MSEKLDLAALMAQAQEKIKEQEAEKQTQELSGELRSRDESRAESRKQISAVEALAIQAEEVKTSIGHAEKDLTDVDQAAATLKAAGMENQLNALYEQKRAELTSRQQTLDSVYAQLSEAQSQHERAESAIAAVESNPAIIEKLHEEAVSEVENLQTEQVSSPETPQDKLATTRLQGVLDIEEGLANPKTVRVEGQEYPLDSITPEAMVGEVNVKEQLVSDIRSGGFNPEKVGVIEALIDKGVISIKDFETGLLARKDEWGFETMVNRVFRNMSSDFLTKHAAELKGSAFVQDLADRLQKAIIEFKVYTAEKAGDKVAMIVAHLNMLRLLGSADYSQQVGHYQKAAQAFRDKFGSEFMVAFVKNISSKRKVFTKEDLLSALEEQIGSTYKDSEQAMAKLVVSGQINKEEAMALMKKRVALGK